MSFKDNIKKSLGFGENEKESKSKIFVEVEQPFYEIILIRPESEDEMNFVFDQIVDEKNPVIVDLGYFEEEGLEALEMATEKIKVLREEYGAESILLCKTSQKNLGLIAPSRINIVK